ncbi:sensor histidine kinase [Paenibacillus soyae]|uniref:Histidine kinase n=1 Tax=Paenibacillus soyae TaxID=2969249 RepID=A0A9X2MZ93_9BACL|nr:histidine kinase [Paenibacillus soyae]MCR2806262.1 histidine kinase [Paenibacillus soyae]
MYKQYRTFIGMLLVTLISILTVMTMYAYTVNTSLATVREDIQMNNLNRIRYLINNLDHNVEQLSMLAMTLETDSKVGLLSSVHLMDTYDQVQLQLDLADKIGLQSFSRGWDNKISIYSELMGKWIGTTKIQDSLPGGGSDAQWELDSTGERFVYDRSLNGYTIRVAFPKSNLQGLLEGSNIDGNYSFFYHPDQPVISTAAQEIKEKDKIIKALIPILEERTEGTETIAFGGTDYMATFMKAESLGWYMIDCVPLDQALQPIKRTQVFFYIGCVMIFLGGVATLLFLYRKVQVPIVALLKGVRLLKHGDFSVRIHKASRNEFDILYESFNDMAEQIGDLIDKVYKEKIVSREAMVKQLQAQINPHFLYNCLFFIDNMTRLGNEEAVTAMTKNLAEYFRYTTRLDEPVTTLEKELGVVENYLKIQCLRMNRLRYEINVPDSMKQLPVPKLLIQPLAENGVIHGIEQKRQASCIRITGVEESARFRIIVEDDGKGMTETEILELLGRIEQPLDESMGCALWNIRQRMSIYFEQPAGMEIGSSELGGLRIQLYWPRSID